ncbi:MAG: deoxyribodipyrimidine photo-lyase [Motiliproteus sp.]
MLNNNEGKESVMNDVTTLVWFRQDLRINDNPALFYAAEQGSILPVYILDDEHAGEWRLGGASRWWLHQSLTALDLSLDGGLRFFCGDPLRLIPELLQASGIRRVVWNRCYQPWQINRDKALKRLLTDQGIEVHTYNGSLLWEPWSVLKKDQTPYKVFTPYFRSACQALDTPRFPLPAPAAVQLSAHAPKGLPLESLELMPKHRWYQGLALHWQPGERGAADRMAEFVNQGMADYSSGRDRPDIEGTSRLAPHLRFGELSPHQLWYVARQQPLPAAAESDRESFVRQLGWREFSYQLLYHWPGLPRENFQTKFDRLVWRQDPEGLIAWQQGMTGIPLIDAGMRELWQTGYMHNRVRMLVGSFLVKNLGIHWLLGASWFWGTLVDADLANNSASWQWVAGCGTDAAPYFRIFNPVTQGQKFDPQGLYVKRYCPELARLPVKYIHCPWLAPSAVLEECGVILGTHYPRPIVDLKQSRQRALDAFAALNN